MKSIAIKVSVTALTILGSPLLLISAGVLGLSHLLSKPGESLWDKVMSLAILPASLRKPKQELICSFKKIEIESIDGAKLSGAVLFAEKVSPEVAAKLPTVVLFNQNESLMEDTNMQTLAMDYAERGFNVVMFNYRGAGESTGKAFKGEDLYNDGRSVVNQLIGEGFQVDGITLKPDPKYVLLDGSSIGGALAIAVGKEHPEMMLAANRTFTRWVDAAEGFVSKFSNLLFAKLAKAILKETSNAQMDSVANMTARLDSPSHTFTVIETATRGHTDGVLSKQAKLEEGMFSHESAAYDNFEDKTHNSYVGLHERPVLLSKLESLKAEIGYEGLCSLGILEEGLTYSGLSITGRLESLKKHFEKNPDQKSLPLVRQEILRIKENLEGYRIPNAEQKIEIGKVLDKLLES